jgi:hypothetical protein
VSLPDGRIAWFPASPAGARRLAVRVLGVLAARCSDTVSTSPRCKAVRASSRPRPFVVAPESWSVNHFPPEQVGYYDLQLPD